jgi:hypothetical protein
VCIQKHSGNLHSQGKDPKTIRAYKVAVEEFRKSCTKKFLSEIGRQDLIDFMGWLRKQPPKLRKDGTPRKPRRSGDPNPLLRIAQSPKLPPLFQTI